MKPPPNWPTPPNISPQPDPVRVAAAVQAMRRRRTRHAQAAASVVAGVIAIAAGGIAVAATVAHGTDRLTTIGPDTPSASSSAPAAAAPCAASALSATYWQIPFGTLKTLTDLRLRNDGTSACTLDGWPTVSITTSSGAIFESSLNRLHAPTNPVTQDDAASTPNPTVTLRRHAYAVLYVITEADPNRACDATVGQHARWTVTLPQRGGTLHLTGPPAVGCTEMPIEIFPFLPASRHPVDSSAFSPAMSD